MDDHSFYDGWTEQLINCIDKICDDETRAALLHGCADYHYKRINMDEVIKDYEGDIEGFIAFLSNKWG